jgi:hypothetical protein
MLSENQCGVQHTVDAHVIDVPAIAEGKRIMADLSAGKDAPVKWGANLTVSRKKPTGLPLPAMQLNRQS